MLPYLYISGDNHMCSQPATITYYHIWRTINHSGKANSLSFYGHIDILVFMIIIRDKAVRPHFNIISYFHISYGTDTREHTYGRPFADLNFAPPNETIMEYGIISARSPIDTFLPPTILAPTPMYTPLLYFTPLSMLFR